MPLFHDLEQRVNHVVWSAETRTRIKIAAMRYGQAPYDMCVGIFRPL